MVAGVTAAWGVKRYSHEARTTGLWWLASALAAAAAMVAALRSDTPVAAGLAAGGLAAAAVIDAVEGRIPARLAQGTTLASLVALAAQATATGEWWMVGRAILLTAVLVLGLGALWVAHQVGFGDVRLAAALVTAMTGGVGGLVVLVYVAFPFAGAVVVVRRLRRRRGTFPFGPALILGWLVAVALS